ncbi:DUF1115 domain containing protein [Rhodotorula toruloides]|uniref:DUF1115 domain containing protein n=1 Tax=Rhodotorula toruloides TaxID=5286 RepID=A0A511K6W0_RHOTO|nr:DUF1115 domain containing protein [Rhodotorula toruloides]
MLPEQIKDELLVLQASCVEGELAWDDDDARWAWEPVLDGPAELDDLSLPLPTISLRISDSIELTAEYRAHPAPPELSLHCLRLERDEQADLRRQLEEVFKRCQDEADPLPVFNVLTALQEYLAAHPPASASHPSTPPNLTRPHHFGRLQLKTVLMWSHHLLATSKRKDIVAWSTELELWGLSKPGYPGVIIAEGLASNVDHFIQVVKSWQWKALQVRCELDGPVIEPPPDFSPKEAATWAVRTKSHLGPVLGKDAKEKICVKEVEGLHEVGEIMRAAGLEDVFYTALKLQK